MGHESRTRFGYGLGCRQGAGDPQISTRLLPSVLNLYSKETELRTDRIEYGLPVVDDITGSEPKHATAHAL